MLPVSAAPVYPEIQLSAQTSRAVRATVAMYTDKGYYTVELPELALSAPVGADPSKDPARSVTVAIALPDKGATILETWIASATVTQGKPEWVAAGLITCFPPQYNPLKPHEVRTPDPHNTPMPVPTADPAVTPLVAVRAPGLERTDCPIPFSDALVIRLERPVVPETFDAGSGTSIIGITLDPTAKVIAADVLESSHVPGFDGATQRAAQQTIYTPAIAFCKPTYGRYIFKASYHNN